MSITVRPATVHRWEDVVEVFAGRGGSTCWCQLFRGTEGKDKPTVLHVEIEGADRPVGLIAYVDDEPAGWSRVDLRTSLPGIEANQALRRLYAHDDADPAWWVSCVACIAVVVSGSRYYATRRVLPAGTVPPSSTGIRSTSGV